MGSILGHNRVIAKKCIWWCFVKCATLIVYEGGMAWPKTGATHHHAQLGLLNKGLVVCTVDLLNGLALGCFNRPPV